jgi:hypothetical protein
MERVRNQLALENQIVGLLKVWKEWETKTLETFLLYQKFGGTSSRQQFDNIVARLEGDGK